MAEAAGCPRPFLPQSRRCPQRGDVEAIEVDLPEHGLDPVVFGANGGVVGTGEGEGPFGGNVEASDLPLTTAALYEGGAVFSARGRVGVASADWAIDGEGAV